MPATKVEVARRLADVSKAQRLLGVTAALGLNEILADLVAWLNTQPMDIRVASAHDPHRQAQRGGRGAGVGPRPWFSG